MNLTAELGIALSDVILCLGTFWLGLKFRGVRGPHTWRSFFFALSTAAGVGALYHGFSRFHEPSFWVLVSVASMTASFLFFAACSLSGKPNWKWLTLLWPLYGLLGIITGTMLATYPFWMITAVSLILIFLSIYVLQGNPHKECRQNIIRGLGITIIGFVAQKFISKEGFINNNVIFHLLQLTGNYFIWRGANKA